MRNPIQARTRSAISINMTPMIDVTFLLIIFFLVSSHLSKQEKHAKLDLPSTLHAVSAEILAADNSVTLNVFDNGELKLGANPIDLQQLKEILVAKNASVDGKLQVRIRCSQQAAFAIVNPILAVLVAAQVTDVVFAVYDVTEGGAK